MLYGHDLQEYAFFCDINWEGHIFIKIIFSINSPVIICIQDAVSDFIFMTGQ